MTNPPSLTPTIPLSALSSITCCWKPKACLLRACYAFAPTKLTREFSGLTNPLRRPSNMASRTKPPVAMATHPARMNLRQLSILSARLALRGIASLRYQFPYMEHRAKRPDPPQLAQATTRAAMASALNLIPELPLIAGGKSFGGRMTSQAQAKAPLPGVRGLAFLGFPLHPASRPSQDRAKHLFEVQIPMLFLQGTRDKLATLDQIEPVCKKLGNRATLKLFDPRHPQD
jgi:predicted alpha/beta-hydrolase family hydrolase